MSWEESLRPYHFNCLTKLFDGVRRPEMGVLFRVCSNTHVDEKGGSIRVSEEKTKPDT